MPEGEPRVQGFICKSREMRWGWGATPDAAIKMARKANGGGGARKGDRLVYALPVGAIDAYVDQMGNIAWTWADDYTGDRHLAGLIIEEPKGK